VNGVAAAVLVAEFKRAEQHYLGRPNAFLFGTFS
jgi:hypothetical protein